MKPLVNLDPYSPVIWVPMWGVSKLRKRGGSFAGEIPGDAEWFDSWYDRVMSEDTVKRFADLGVNLVILPFSLGGSAEAEASEHADFKRMTGLLHQHGILSLPYFQYQNILQEENALTDAEWAVRLDGGRQQYGDWRRTVCQSSPGFIAYMNGLTDKALARGADGIWIDNTYLHPCRCERCETDFKAYLADEHPELLDALYLTDFKKTEIPSALAGYNRNDPIARCFKAFNCLRSLNVMTTLRNHLKEKNAEAIFATNPALFRGDSLADKGVDLKAFTDLHDLIYLENKRTPEEIEDGISGNYPGLSAVNATGTRAVCGTWRHPDFDAGIPEDTTGLPVRPRDFERMLLEPVLFGQVIGMFWAARAIPLTLCKSEADLEKIYLEKPEVESVCRSTLAFIKALPFWGTPWKEQAGVSVLIHRESMAMFPQEGHAAVHTATEMLLQAGIPYKSVFSESLSDKGALNATRLLILPAITIMSDDEAEALKQFTESGGRLLCLGLPGTLNGAGLFRRDSLLKPFTGFTRYRPLTKGTVLQSPDGNSLLVSSEPGALPVPNLSVDGVMYQHWFKEDEGVLARIEAFCRESSGTHLTGRHKILVTVLEGEATTTIQLLNYSDEPEEETVTLVVPGRAPSAAAICLGQENPITLAPTVTANNTTYAVPVTRYTCLQIGCME